MRFPASFYDRPLSIKFTHQEDDEHIELFLRQHWVTNFLWIFTAALGFILPFILPFIFRVTGLISLLQLPQEISWAVLFLWYMFVLAYVIEKFLHWYFNIYIVTNQHLVDIDFHNLMHPEITEARLEDVQSASSKVPGILGSLFNFGNVVIETAAKKQGIEFLFVPKPYLVSDRVQDLRQLQRGGHNAN